MIVRAGAIGVPIGEGPNPGFLGGTQMEARPHSPRTRGVAGSGRMIDRFVTPVRRRAIASR